MKLHLNIKEVKKPELKRSILVAENIAQQLSKKNSL